MRNFEPIAAVRSLSEAYPNVHILVLTGYEDEVLARTIAEVSDIRCFAIKGIAFQMG